MEKRRGLSTKCFGLVFTAEDVKTSWVNRKLDDLKIKMPINFEELEQYMDGHLLDCSLNMDEEAINYETKALHFSAHMFFEKPEVKKALYNLVRLFAIKNQYKNKRLNDFTQFFQRRKITDLLLKKKLVKPD